MTSAPFIKFGCIKDEKFAEKMNDYILFKNLDGKYLTLKDCLEENKEKHENTVFYVTDEKEQSQYINMFKQGRPGRSYPAPQHRQPVHWPSGAEERGLEVFTHRCRLKRAPSRKRSRMTMQELQGDLRDSD